MCHLDGAEGLVNTIYEGSVDTLETHWCLNNFHIRELNSTVLKTLESTRKHRFAVILYRVTVILRS